jgi:pimeloyl-ACP methyl ester carboxylesterase
MRCAFSHSSCCFVKSYALLVPFTEHDMKIFNANVIRSAIAVLTLVAGTTALADDRIGVILMHGKKATAAHLRSLAGALQDNGYLVVTPDMPWSQTRAYDRSLGEAHQEIDALADQLRMAGARKIVVAGHSMGANMAINYVATHQGVDAVMALGPGQTVESRSFADALGSSLAKAKAMVAADQSNVVSEFADLHLGKVGSASTTARIYLSYFDPEGLANMSEMAKRIHIPLLWTVGDLDRNMLDRGQAYAFDLAQPNALSRYEVVHADHMGTPEASRDVVLRWLSAVFPKQDSIRATSSAGGWVPATSASSAKRPR